MKALLQKKLMTLIIASVICLGSLFAYLESTAQVVVPTIEGCRPTGVAGDECHVTGLIIEGCVNNSDKKTWNCTIIVEEPPIDPPTEG